MKITLYKDRSLVIDKLYGTMNENNVTELEIIVPKEYENYNKKIVFLHNDEVIGWDLIENNKYTLKKSITKYEKVEFYLWLTNGEDDFRSATRQITFYENKDANNEITEEELNGINKLLDEVEELKEKVDNIEFGEGGTGGIIPETLYALGADYAEYFEWEDGNPDNEDRTSLFVSIVYGTRKIKKAMEGEDILGITSIDASVIGNARYKDEKTYSAVGMTGVMKVKDNGTCQVGDYIVPGDNGLAIPSENDVGYKVTARYSEDLIEVLMAHDAEMISRIKKEIDNIEFTGTGAKEVHIGSEEPTGEEEIWIDTSEEAEKNPTKTSELENDSGFIEHKGVFYDWNELNAYEFKNGETFLLDLQGVFNVYMGTCLCQYSDLNLSGNYIYKYIKCLNVNTQQNFTLDLVGKKVTLNQMPIQDTNNYFTNDKLDDVLQEIGGQINGIEELLGGI